MKANSEATFLSIVSGSRRGVAAAVARFSLSILEPFYATAMRWRNWMFDHGWRAAHRVDRTVISIGNLTTGGTGKTPIVTWLVNELRRRGHTPAVLMRGYKSVDGVSDEAELLKRAVAPSRVYAQPDRVEAARRAIQIDPAISCFVLDDGFQHRRLARQADIVLIDATQPFGFDHILPRGLLREPIGGLKRADAIIITRCDRVNTATIEAIEQRVRSITGKVPILRCELKIDHLLDEQNQRHEFPPRSFAFAGIGNAQNFFDQLGVSVVGFHAFPDHHAYELADLFAIGGMASESGATQFVTTEKDWVKIEPLLARVGPKRLPVFRAVLGVAFVGGGDSLLQLIEALKRHAY